MQQSTGSYQAHPYVTTVNANNCDLPPGYHRKPAGGGGFFVENCCCCCTREREFLEESKCRRRFTACYLGLLLFSLIAGGIALFAIGMVQIAKGSKARENVEVYNRYVEHVKGEYGSIDLWGQFAGAFLNAPAARESQTLQRCNTNVRALANNAGPIASHSSSHLAAQMLAYVDGQSLMVQTPSFHGQNFSHAMPQIPYFRKVTTEIKDYWDYNDQDFTQAVCRTLFGPTARYVQQDYSPSCEYTAVLTSVCFAVDSLSSTPSWSQSCFYPFTSDSHQYSPLRGSDASAATSGSTTVFPFAAVVVTIRHQDDPYIKMQALTKGTMDFGHMAQMLGVAALLILLGLSMIIGTSVSACCYWWKCLGQDPEMIEQMENKIQGAQVTHVMQPVEMVPSPHPYFTQGVATGIPVYPDCPPSSNPQFVNPLHQPAPLGTIVVDSRDESSAPGPFTFDTVVKIIDDCDDY